MTRSERRLMRCAIFAMMLSSACGVYEREQQVKTVANMQTVTHAIEAFQSQTAVLTDQQMRSAIARVNGGRDAWGTAIAYRLRLTRGQSSYILVSAGSDRKFDVASLEKYFEMPAHYSKDDPTRDLVFRDGDEITLAGK